MRFWRITRSAARRPGPGEKFTLVSADSKLVGKIGFEVVLLARKVETRCIAKVRSEKFAGLSRSGAIQREIVWKVRWRVAAEELSAFYGQTGLCPADWTEEEECIITDISPKRLSEMEYELDIEAQHPGNPGCSAGIRRKTARTSPRASMSRWIWRNSMFRRKWPASRNCRTAASGRF